MLYSTKNIEENHIAESNETMDRRRRGLHPDRHVDAGGVRLRCAGCRGYSRGFLTLPGRIVPQLDSESRQSERRRQRRGSDGRRAQRRHGDKRIRAEHRGSDRHRTLFFPARSELLEKQPDVAGSVAERASGGAVVFLKPADRARSLFESESEERVLCVQPSDLAERHGLRPPAIAEL